MYRNLLLVFLFLIIPLETSLFSFPFFFTLAVLTYIVDPEALTIFFIFAGSIVLDILKIVPPGSTAISLFIAFLAIEILKREVIFKDYKFIIAFLLASSYIYARVFSYSDSLILYALVYGFIFLITFYFVRQYR